MASTKTLIDTLADRLSTSKTAAEGVLNETFQVVLDELVANGTVRLPGLGKLVLKTRRARTARNPRTGDPVDVPERTVVRLQMFPSEARLIEELTAEDIGMNAGLTD